MDQIDVLNSKLILVMDDKYPIDLINGKMGLCIYYYYLSRWEEKEEFKQIAGKLLDDVVSNLSETMNITVAKGLAGIAIGISHLVKKKIIGGDINAILEDIDSCIFKRLVFINNKDSKNQISKAEFIRLLYYLYLRYTVQSFSDGKYIFRELIIKTIEIFEHNLQVDFFNEHFSFSVRNFHLPFFLYTISKIYNLSIYNERITKILEEFITQILSMIPVLHANLLPDFITFSAPLNGTIEN
jgi:lantibiotic modifying enzyme